MSLRRILSQRAIQMSTASVSVSGRWTSTGAAINSGDMAGRDLDYGVTERPLIPQKLSEQMAMVAARTQRPTPDPHDPFPSHRPEGRPVRPPQAWRNEPSHCFQ